MLTSLRAHPRPVAIGRILLALGAVLTTGEGVVQVTELQAGKVTTPVAGWLPDVSWLPLGAWLVVMLAAAGFLLLGLAPGVGAGSLALGHALLLALDHQLYSNHRFLLVLLCTWFVLASADHAWAPGSRRRRERDGPLVPWWPQLLVVASVSSCYLFAGLSKLNPVFLSGATIADLTPAWVPAQALAWATPPTEIAIAACLWFRRTRFVVIVLGVGLHVSIVVLMEPPLVFAAFALTCMTAYPLAGVPRAPVSVTPTATSRGRVGPAP